MELFLNGGAFDGGRDRMGRMVTANRFFDVPLV
jgi:hypothetical protein